MNNIFFQIPHSFAGHSENSVLTIKKNNNEYQFSVTEQSNAINSTLTCEHLKDIFGRETLERICRKPYVDIDLKQIDQGQLIFTKNIARKFFIGLLDFQKTDLDEMRSEGSTKDKISNLFNFQIEAVEHIEPLFMLDRPILEKFDQAKTSGKGIEGLAERVYIRYHHHYMVVNEPDNNIAKLRDIEMLTSRLADREMQKGEILHLSNGYFFVDHVIIGGGAYIYILKDIDGINTPKIICRGTAMRRTATGAIQSGINDLLIEIGLMGISTIWPELSQYLIENKIQSVELLGKSLGGAYAQNLAVLIEGLHGIEIKNLTTCCSVGVGETVNNLFKKEIIKKRTKPFKIQVIRNGGFTEDQIDYIPIVGGVHLGQGISPKRCDIKICYIQSGNEEVGCLSTQNKGLHLIKRLLFSFRSGHSRQTTLQEFNWKMIDKVHIDEHLCIGMQLEKIRKVLAYPIHFLSLPYIKAHSFTDYFYSHRNKTKL